MFICVKEYLPGKTSLKVLLLLFLLLLVHLFHFLYHRYHHRYHGEPRYDQYEWRNTNWNMHSLPWNDPVRKPEVEFKRQIKFQWIFPAIGFYSKIQIGIKASIGTEFWMLNFNLFFSSIILKYSENIHKTWKHCIAGNQSMMQIRWSWWKGALKRSKRTQGVEVKSNDRYTPLV